MTRPTRTTRDAAPSVPRRLRGPLAALLTLAVALPAAAQPGGPVPVAASTVVRRDVGRGPELRRHGRCPVRTSIVGSTVEERVVEFPVSEGDRVEAGPGARQAADDDAGDPARRRPGRAGGPPAGAGRAGERHPARGDRAGPRPAGAGRGAARPTRPRAARLEDLFRKRQASAEELDEAVSDAEQAEQAYRGAGRARPARRRAPGRADRPGPGAGRTPSRRRSAGWRTSCRAHHRRPVRRLRHRRAHRGRPVGRDAATRSSSSPSSTRSTSPSRSWRTTIRYLRRRHAGAASRSGPCPTRRSPARSRVVVPQADLRSRTFPVKVRVANEESPGGPAAQGGDVRPRHAAGRPRSGRRCWSTRTPWCSAAQPGRLRHRLDLRRRRGWGPSARCGEPGRRGRRADRGRRGPLKAASASSSRATNGSVPARRSR